MNVYNFENSLFSIGVSLYKLLLQEHILELKEISTFKLQETTIFSELLSCFKSDIAIFAWRVI